MSEPRNGWLKWVLLISSAVTLTGAVAGAWQNEWNCVPLALIGFAGAWISGLGFGVL